MSGRQRWGYVTPEHCAVKIITERVGSSLLGEMFSLLLAWAAFKGTPHLLLDAVWGFGSSPCDCSCCGLSSVSPSNIARVFMSYQESLWCVLLPVVLYWSFCVWQTAESCGALYTLALVKHTGFCAGFALWSSTEHNKAMEGFPFPWKGVEPTVYKWIHPARIFKNKCFFICVSSKSCECSAYADLKVTSQDKSDHLFCC